VAADTLLLILLRLYGLFNLLRESLVAPVLLREILLVTDAKASHRLQSQENVDSA
jgi:hypothetical protein